jgi:acyl-CoA synthetase (NDP forming)
VSGSAGAIASRKSALTSLFSPGSVAVVGASPKEESLGRRVVESIQALAPDCRLAAIGPSANALVGVESAASLRELAHVPEAIVVAVNTQRIMDVVRDAAELGVRAAVIFAGGFAEAGASGRRLQEEIRALAERADMAIIGPNCQGIINFVRPMPLYADTVDKYAAGRAALLSQSGSVTTSLINNRRGVRWSHAVSTGNESCIDAADVLEYFLDTPEVEVICAFLETIRRPERFFALCEEAREAGKAVVACKTGRTLAAQQAAAAHSGALATPDRLVDGLLRRHGVIRTESLSELLETTKALASGLRPSGRRVAALSGSGGHIELVLDEAEKWGLEIAPFSAETQARLQAVLNGTGTADNPFDYWGIPNLADALPRALGVMAGDPNVDILLGLVDFSHGPTGRGPRANRLLDAWKNTADRAGRMLVLLDAIGGTPPPEAIERALEDRVLVLSELGTGLKALAHLVEHASDRPQQPNAAPSPPSLDGVVATFSELRSGANSGALPLQLIDAAGIPVLDTTVIANGEPFDPHAVSLPFPLVAKVADPTIAHKAHRGGVALGIRTHEELAAAVSRLRGLGDGSVMIQHHVSADIELLAGLTSAPGLGSFVMVGVGGVLTEASDDVAIRPLGLGPDEPEAMLAELRAYEALRAHPSFTQSLPAIVGVIQSLDQLGRVLGERLEALDVNPLMVTSDGCVAVDALLVVRK